VANSAASSTPPDAPSAPAGSAAPAVAGPARLTFKGVALPGAAAPASLDYIAYERAHARVWVPVGDTGSVDVYDPAGGTFTRVDGFKKAERENNGKKRMMGPSSVAIGDGVAYVGDRASSEVCAIDAGALKLGKCLTLASSPDGVAYVASAKEVWVTTPRDSTLTVLDASKPDELKLKTTVKLQGRPEGYAVDEEHGMFLTNLEDKDRTVVVDVKTHTPKATWTPDCGADGPRGIAADLDRGFVYVACTDHVVVLDGAHDGTSLGKIDVGAGIDNIDWLEPQRLLYVSAGKAARLVVLRVDATGKATVAAEGESTEGARNGVADASGNAYLADPRGARLLVFAYAP
jgi:DNA-binding beta-propeller fold protein YncE